MLSNFIKPNHFLKVFIGNTPHFDHNSPQRPMHKGIDRWGVLDKHSPYIPHSLPISIPFIGAEN